MRLSSKSEGCSVAATALALWMSRKGGVHDNSRIKNQDSRLVLTRSERCICMKLMVSMVVDGSDSELYHLSRMGRSGSLFFPITSFHRFIAPTISSPVSVEKMVETSIHRCQKKILLRMLRNGVWRA